MRQKTILIVLTIVLWVFSAHFATAQTPTPTSTPTPTQSSTPTPTPDNSATESKLRSEIQELETKISDLQTEQKSLNSQIEIANSQIELSELKIRDTRGKIAELQDDINITEDKIYDLEGKIHTSSETLIKRIVSVYQAGEVEPWQILLTSDNVTDFLTRLTYLQIVEEYEKKALLAAEQAKVSYANQKDILGEKVDKEIELQAELEQYTAQLEESRLQKEDLLRITKNSEKEYQSRLADALRELQQISDAAKILVSTEPRNVERGEPIGLMGNTGYSFGAHLHFGIYNITKLEDYNYYSSHESPSNALESQTVNWSTDCGEDPSGSSPTGGGSFAWPMQTSGLYISQGYGVTCYSNIYYGGRPHPAYDMYNNSNIVVRAVEKGKAYICRNCTGDGANGVFLFHENGKMSLYWHLQ